MIDSPDERQFSDEELGKILKSATEFQARGAERGLSRAEVDAVAGEVGIDAALVERAVRQLDTPQPNHTADWLLGTPAEFAVERTLSLTTGAAGHEVALNAVREACSDVRDIAQLGQQFNCRAKLGAAHVEIGVTTTAGKTAVRIHVKLNDVVAETIALRGVILGGGVGFLAFAATINNNLLLAGALGLLSVGTGLYSARRRYLQLAAQYRARAEGLADTIVGRLSA